MSVTAADEEEPKRTAGELAREALLFVPDILRMFTGVLRDPRVPRRTKVQVAALVALGLSPVDLIPVLGQVELVAGIALAARQLVKHAGVEVLREHWAGSEEGFRLVLTLVDAGLRPRKLAWRLLRGQGR